MLMIKFGKIQISSKKIKRNPSLYILSEKKSHDDKMGTSLGDEKV